jgi:hypothetical protein
MSRLFLARHIEDGNGRAGGGGAGAAASRGQAAATVGGGRLVVAAGVRAKEAVAGARARRGGGGVSQNGQLLSRCGRSSPANASVFDTHRDSISSRFDCRAGSSSSSSSSYDILTCTGPCSLTCHEPRTKMDGTHTLENQHFAFDHVFGDQTTTADVYRDSVAPALYATLDEILLAPRPSAAGAGGGARASSSSSSAAGGGRAGARRRQSSGYGMQQPSSTRGGLGGGGGGKPRQRASLTVFAYGQTGSGKTFTMEPIYAQVLCSSLLVCRCVHRQPPPHHQR